MNLLGGGNPMDPLRRALQTAARITGSRGLVEGALRLEREIKRQLSQPGTGRLYPRGKKRVHQASAPGEPPAVDVGRLRASIGHEQVTVLGETISIKVGTNVKYAAPLEYGTTDGRIAPRPFMRPALAAVQGEMSTAVVAELKGTAIDLRRG